MSTALPPVRPLPSETLAYRRAAEHIDAVVEVLTDTIGAAVRLVRGIRNSVGLDAGEIGPRDLCNVEVSHTLGGLPDDEPPLLRNERYFARVKEFWARRGYLILADSADSPDPQPEWFRTLYARHPGDGCRVSLKQGKAGNLWLTASLVARRRRED